MKQLDRTAKVVSFPVRTECIARKADSKGQVGLHAEALALVSEEEKREFLVGLAGYVDEVLGNRVRAIEQGLLGEQPAPRSHRARLFTVIDGGRT